jgi:polysaccharide biosynthesis transport protein
MPTEPEAKELELRDYVRVLRRRKWTVGLTALVVIGGAVAFSYVQTPEYEAQAELLVRPRNSESVVNPDATRTAAAADAKRAIETEIKVLESRNVRRAVRRKLGRRVRVSASAAGETDVINVTARSRNREQVAEDANAYAETYLEVRRKRAVDDFLNAGQEVQAKVDDLQRQIDALPPSLTPGAAGQTQRQSLEQQQAFYRRQLDQLQVAAQISQTGGGQVVSEAGTPGDPVSPDMLRTGLLALALGLLLGVGLAFLRDYLDDSIRTKDDLERASAGLPVLGLIPAMAAWRNHKTAYLVTAEKPTSPAAEAYRTLRTSVQFLGLERPLHTLVVTSPTKAEGKTTTLANLAVTLAQAGNRVALLDCDLRRPRIHQFFGLTNEVGFTSVLLGTDPLAVAVRPVEAYPSLYILASGPPPPDPSELLSSQRTREVVDALRARCDFLLIDSPPVLPVSDALVLSGFVDAMLLVVSADQTTKRGLNRSVELLMQMDAPLLGTVLNDIGPERAYAYGHAGYAYYERRSKGGRKAASTPNGGRGRVRAHRDHS